MLLLIYINLLKQMKYLLITLISILFTYSLASDENESDLTLIPDTDIVTIVGEGYDIFTISKGKDGSFDVHLIKKNDYIICKVGHKQTNCYSLNGKI
mgnify:CR=1 FL=1